MIRRCLFMFAVPIIASAAACGRTDFSRAVDPRADARPEDATPEDAGDVGDSDQVPDAPDLGDAPDTGDIDTDMPDTDDTGDALDVSDAPDIPDVPDVPGCIDRDHDGFGVGATCLGPDCDDASFFVNPAAAEVCNDIDDDCDGENDEGCPPDLIVDAETIELDGDQLYDRVEILNGGRINVPRPPPDFTDDCGPGGPGCLSIQARIILIRAASGIDASGAGQCALGLGDEAGFGPGLANVGPGGGGYGGAGGAGPELSGGSPYGTASGADIQFGSPGRGFVILVPGFEGAACDDLTGFESHGGAGGGCIVLSAPDIDIGGFVRSDGLAGEAARDGSTPGIVDGGAGGSGGGILLQGERVLLRPAGSLVARGGAGGRGGTYSPGDGQDQCIGNGGGGGGGGRIKVYASTLVDSGPSVDVDGGAGATGPQNDASPGAPGTAVLR